MRVLTVSFPSVSEPRAVATGSEGFNRSIRSLPLPVLTLMASLNLSRPGILFLKKIFARPVAQWFPSRSRSTPIIQ